MFKRNARVPETGREISPSEPDSVKRGPLETSLNTAMANAVMQRAAIKGQNIRGIALVHGEGYTYRLSQEPGSPAELGMLRPKETGVATARYVLFQDADIPLEQGVVKAIGDVDKCDVTFTPDEK